MQTHYHLDRLPDFRSAVITIGSFDGVHLGHQQLLARIRRMAEARNGESVVITFDPHPRTVLRPDDNSLRLLSTIEEKIGLCDAHGIDHLVVVPFDIAFSEQSPTEYIEQFLVANFRPDRIIIGYDHRFGKDRAGDVDLLRYYATVHDYEVVEIIAREVRELTVSSTKIRNALGDGKIDTANALLGRPYAVTGDVVRGKQIGRTIGYPTANLYVTNPLKLVPADGIYAVKADVGGRRLKGMLYIGHRPALSDGRGRTVELNLFDFEGDLYDRTITVHFQAFLRSDLDLPDLNALRSQLIEDETAAREYFGEEEKAHRQNRIKSPSTAIVILNYNGREYLQRFLPSVLRNLAENCRVVVADNASTDDSLDYLAEHHPEIETIALTENRGYAGGYNAALQQVDAEIYCLLNSDVRVTEGWLQTILLHFEDPLVGAVQPKILSEHRPERFEYAGASGGYLDFLGYPFCRGRVFNHTERDEGQYDCPAEIFWATGAALFIRSTAFHNLQGFEPEYFAHAEEIDLCWRMKRAGYKIMVEPRAKVYHVGGGTLAYDTPRKAYLNFRNTLITGYKNEHTTRLFWWLPVRLLLDGAAAGLFLFQGKFGHILSILRAHFAFYAKLPVWAFRRSLRTKEIELVRVGPPRIDSGRVGDSIALHHYLLGHDRFSEIVIKQIGAGVVEEESTVVPAKTS